MGKTKRSKKANKHTKKQRKTPKKKIVIGKIYADWCGHCKTLKPEWEQMKDMIKLNTGRSLKNVEFQIHEMGETSENDMRNISLQQQLDDFNYKHFPNGEQKVASDGFPTLFKICRKRIEYYNGPRNAKELYSWYTKKC